MADKVVFAGCDAATWEDGDDDGFGAGTGIEGAEGATSPTDWGELAGSVEVGGGVTTIGGVLAAEITSALGGVDGWATTGAGGLLAADVVAGSVAPGCGPAGAVGAELPDVKPASRVSGVIPRCVGTFPVPGVPIVGKTVPSCRLPRLGFAAVGWEGTLAVAAFPLFPDFPSAKTIGGSDGGGGGNSGDESLLATWGGFGRRRNIPASPADAPAAGAPARWVSAGPTVSMIRLPSDRRRCGCAWSRSTTKCVIGGVALFKPMRTLRTPW
jgi:hypothetical protein